MGLDKSYMQIIDRT